MKTKDLNTYKLNVKKKQKKIENKFLLSLIPICNRLMFVCMHIARPLPVHLKYM